MAAKKKNYYYVLVLTSEGPVFVTETKYHDAMWDKNKPPKLFSKAFAEDVALGLALNFHSAFMVTTKYELTTQPYRYDKGNFEWKNKEDN